ncbi:hypothetical protein K1T71_011571 [Dendrolimus kikuchii]|uniref:Uncharacterized protein n=1 Tax=Dendrolimus kikuchii TaxID=765133 RepID=A0ACC1CPF3_9NEOP|nr:hypothetical protein K1T71_011571 [Dendrolimus kikuchii]
MVLQLIITCRCLDVRTRSTSTPPCFAFNAALTSSRVSSDVRSSLKLATSTECSLDRELAEETAVVEGWTNPYLHRVAGREPSPDCKQCGAPLDTAVHTLMECAAWGPQRHSLQNVVGPVDSLQGMVAAMLRSEDCWAAVASFCEAVMLQKEAAEREREEDAAADPIRRRRTGRRRGRYAHLLPP